LLERLKDTVGDVAETIKRAFTGPKVHSARQFFLADPVPKAMALLSAASKSTSLSLSANFSVATLFVSTSINVPNVQFEARAQSESGGTFNAGARLVSVQVAWPGVVKSAGIPQLNSPIVKTNAGGYSVFTTISYALPPFSLRHEKNYMVNPTIESPACITSLGTIFERPIRVRSENIDKIPKPLWMRYTFHLLKETGENIRNLEIIGLFSIPKKGVQSLRHDHSTGSLMVTVDQDAQNSDYYKLMLARNKNNSEVVSCILEDT
jgi:hypothetical protein